MTLNLEAVNHPERTLTIHKKIQVDEITWAHGNPTFLFSVNGVDIEGKEHSYHRVVEFTEDYVREHQTGGYVTLSTTITGIPAGEYKIMEDTPVMRYVLTDAVAGSENVSVVKKDVEMINGFMKIQADVSADLRPADGNVTFENHKTHFDKVSHNSTVIKCDQNKRSKNRSNTSEERSMTCKCKDHIFENIYKRKDKSRFLMV